MTQSQKIPIFRMTHIDNMPFILKNGLWSKLSGFLDPDFKAIGNADIIGRRTNKKVVVVPPGGVLGEYVPFYFSGHSPMLLNIATGYGVPRVSQHDIVFMECDAIQIVARGIPFCFTDGNATKSISRFFNDLNAVTELDWNTIRATLWKNTDEDYDRVRKKMAEFLVKDHVSSSLIQSIIVRDEASRLRVSNMLQGAPIKVEIDTNNQLYYQQYD